jgi:hemoglobin-like flavoprotein
MDLRESIDEILRQSDKLADLFYLVFLDDYPEVQEYFHGVDMKRQNTLLTMALIIVERNVEGPYAIAESYLQILGRKHQERGIPRELYPKWRAAMMGTLERFHGPTWNDQLAKDWSKALTQGIEVMLAVYP